MAPRSTNLILRVTEEGVGSLDWDLNQFIRKGCAAVDRRAFDVARRSGEQLGTKHLKRVPLVKALHEVLEGRLARGDSPATVENGLRSAKSFFEFVDINDLPDPTRSNVIELYVEWMSAYKNQLLNSGGNEDSRYAIGSAFARLIAPIVQVAPGVLYRRAALTRRSRAASSSGALSNPRARVEPSQFGPALLDVCNALTREALLGPLPLRIKLRTGLEFDEWCGVKADRLKGEITRDELITARSCAINCRIEAEMLIFIAQTGANRAQAWNLPDGEFRFESINEGYGVRRFKGRRLGEVEFHIFKEYRPFFERFLQWRKDLGIADGTRPLFGYVTRRASMTSRQRPHFSRLHYRFKMLGIKFEFPRVLKSNRANWFLQQGGAIDIVAEMNGDTSDVLQDHYVRPDHRRATVELVSFWNSQRAPAAAAGPGACSKAKTPQIVPLAPSSAPKPDCLAPEGCLFCVHHRDIDSFAHVWSLHSFRYLKTIELARELPAANQAPQPSDNSHPAAIVINRLTRKIGAFTRGRSEQGEWVAEAEQRMSEGKHHRRWAGWIALAEIIR